MKESVQTIARHSSEAMGISPLGFNYCRIEDLLMNFADRSKAPHRHDYFVILWFTEGHGKHMVDFTTYTITPDTLFFLTRNQIHAFLQPGVGTKGHMLRFSANFLRAEQTVPLTETLSLFKRHVPPVCHPQKRDLDSLRTLLQLMYDEYQQEMQFLHKDTLCYLLKAFLLIAERNHANHTLLASTPPALQKKFEQFEEILDTHFLHHFSVDRYASLLRISVKSLRQLCMTVTGMSAKQIITERILLEAKNYLVYTDLDIQEIADKLGFEDPSYFSRFFRQQTQTSPSTYRAQHGTKIPE